MNTGDEGLRCAAVNLAHFSDLHGNLDPLDDVAWPVDAWVSTGDFFPDPPWARLSGGGRFQRAWFAENANRLRARFGTTPVAVVDGNHDFAPLADLLRTIGVNVHAITLRGFDLLGHRWAGFRHIPAMGGHWPCEAPDAMLDTLARTALGSGADVLCVHAPPASMLSGPYGNRPLYDRLAAGGHNVGTVLCGHVHEHAGQSETRHLGRPVTVHNGALGVQLVRL